MLLQGLSCTTQVHGALLAMITCIKSPYGTSSATNHSLPLGDAVRGHTKSATTHIKLFSATGSSHHNACKTSLAAVEVLRNREKTCAVTQDPNIQLHHYQLSADGPAS